MALCIHLQPPRNLNWLLQLPVLTSFALVSFLENIRLLLALFYNSDLIAK